MNHPLILTLSRTSKPITRCLEFVSLNSSQKSMDISNRPPTHTPKNIHTHLPTTFTNITPFEDFDCSSYIGSINDSSLLFSPENIYEEISNKLNESTNQMITNHNIFLGSNEKRMGKRCNPSEKKEKNKVAATKSRRRKKIYIESLHNEIMMLKSELAKYKDAIEEYRTRDLRSQSKRFCMKEELSRVTKCPEELKMLYNPIICNEVRNSNVNKLFKEMIDCMLNSLNRYVLWYPLQAFDGNKKNSKQLKYTTMYELSSRE